MRDEAVKSSDLAVAGVSQPVKLAGAAWGPAAAEQWGVKTRAVDFFDVKCDVEVLFGRQLSHVRFVACEHPVFHPGRCATIMLDDRACGLIGELHPKWVREEGLASAPVLFEIDLQALALQQLPDPKPLSKQPVVQRDMALWVSSDIAVQSILDTIHASVANDPNLAVVRDVQLFDVWRASGQGKNANESVPVEQAQEVSLAFRFSLQDQDVTLEDERVDQCMLSIRQALEKKHGVRQR